MSFEVLFPCRCSVFLIPSPFIFLLLTTSSILNLYSWFSTNNVDEEENEPVYDPPHLCTISTTQYNSNFVLNSFHKVHHHDRPFLRKIQGVIFLYFSKLGTIASCNNPPPLSFSQLKPTIYRYSTINNSLIPQKGSCSSYQSTLQYIIGLSLKTIK